MAAQADQYRNAIEPVEVRSGVARFADGSTRAYRPVQIRANSARIETIDGKQYRLVDVVYATETPVLRYSFSSDSLYNEVLDISEASMDLGRLRNKASVIDSHWAQGSVRTDVLGNVHNVWFEGRDALATLRISNRPSCDELWQDIEDGVVSHVSVGYSARKFETTEEEGQIPTRRLVDWEPHEISFVAVPADSASGVRSNPNVTTPTRELEKPVTTPATQEAPAAVIAGNDNAEVVRAAQAEAASLRRELEIRSYGARFNLEATAIDAAVADTTVDVRSFMDANIDRIAERAKETNVTAIRTGETLDASPAEALALRAEAFAATAMGRAGLKAPVLSERAAQYRGESLRGLAVTCLRNAGLTVSDSDSVDSLVGRSLELRSAGGVIASTDLGNALGGTVKSVLDNAYEAQIAETNYDSWTSSTTVKNFHVNKAVHVGMLTGIRNVSEGGQLPLARINDGARFFQLGTRGIKVSFTREAIINDEFGILLQKVNKLGMLFKHDEQTIAVRALAYGKMTTENGEELIFAADKNNLVNVAALDDDAMEAAFLALSKQVVGVDEDGNGFRINVTPRKLLVSTDQLAPAMRITSTNLATKADDVNVWAKMGIEVVHLPDLPAKTAFLTGASALSDVIQTTRLEGNGGPLIQRMLSTSIMAVEWEAINDFSAFGVGDTGIVKLVIA